MGELKLLDCTLRDGGYVNDWKFGHNNIVSVFERLVEADIDIVEIGFLDERRTYDKDRSIMPDTDAVRKIYGNLDRKNSMIVGMIDYGTCGLEHVQDCEDSWLDGIRVIFKKHLRREAMQFCQGLKDKGYKVFAQLVSVTSYSDEEMLDLISLANKVKPYAVSMVDTYGLMHQDNLSHYFELLNANLDAQIGLGYHGHNNFQMGYANCIAMLAKKTDRMILVDGTLYGMGKSAGNAPVELIAMHMNRTYGKKYDISQMLEAIDANISQFYTGATWGYNMFYYIAASNDCHPSYVKYLMDKRTLSIKSVNEILKELQGEKKLLYDQDYIEKLYVEYQNQEINDQDDIRRLKSQLAGKEILLVGPGISVKQEKDKIQKYIRESEPVVISVNYIPNEIEPDYIFVSNAKRYVQMATSLSRKHYKVIATSNVAAISPKAFQFRLNFSRLMDPDAKVCDHSLRMILKALIVLDSQKVTLAGFDGYSNCDENYAEKDMEYDFVRDMADYFNEYARIFLTEFQKDIEIYPLTESKYIIDKKNQCERGK